MPQPVYVFWGTRDQSHREALKTLVRSCKSDVLYDVPVPRRGSPKGKAWVPDEGGWVSLEVVPQLHYWGLELDWDYDFTPGGN